MNFAGVQSITIPEGDVKSIAIGGVTVWQKPNPLPYDAEVEYVESTGAQYVDTGLTIKEGSIAFSFEAVGSNTNAAFLGQQVALPRLLGWLNSSSSAYVDLGASSARVTFDDAMPDMILAKTALRANAGADYYPIYLFTSRTASGERTPRAKARCRYCQFWDAQGVLVRDYVPVRVGTAGALYDRVTGTVFRSATSTPLVAGPDKNGGTA